MAESVYRTPDERFADVTADFRYEPVYRDAEGLERLDDVR